MSTCMSAGAVDGLLEHASGLPSDAERQAPQAHLAVDAGYCVPHMLHTEDVGLCIAMPFPAVLGRCCSVNSTPAA